MPSIDLVTPSRGWPGGVRPDTGAMVPGTLVTISGQGFHPTPEMDSNRVTFAGPADVRLETPVIWASPNEIAYVADRVIDDSAVSVPPGAFYPMGLTGVAGVAVADTNLYVAVAGQNMVKWRAGSGQWVFRLGPPDITPSQFSGPRGIAADEANNVYVANTGLHRIERYQANLGGTGFVAWGSQGSGDGQFELPRALDAATIDGQTFLFVADTGNSRVVRTAPDGSGFLPFAMPPGVGFVRGVAAHPSGDVYCSDSWGRRILHFDADGSFLGEFGSDVLGLPYGLAIDFDGFLYVADNGSASVKKFDTDQRLMAEFGAPPLASPPSDVELVDPVDVAVGDDKAVWIADRGRNRVVRWFPDGSSQLWVHVPPEARTGEVRVETDDGVSQGVAFRVLENDDVTVAFAMVTQGLEEYPLVAGKKTAVIVEFELGVEGLGSNQPATLWGNPVTDTTRVRVLRDGVLQAELTEFEDFSLDLSLAQGVALEKIIMQLPTTALSEPGAYAFEIFLERIGFLPGTTTIVSKDVTRRRRLKVGAIVLSHLRPDGSLIDGSFPSQLLLYLGDPVGTMSWLDLPTMLSGFASYNRMFPMASELASVELLPPAPIGGLEEDLSENRRRRLLRLLEEVRDAYNEAEVVPYDYLLGILDRRFLAPTAGVTISAGGLETALVTFGLDDAGQPIRDMGRVTAHELAHQLGVVRADSPRWTANGHSSNQQVQTAFPTWNSLRNVVAPGGTSVMFVPDMFPLPTDLGSFFEVDFNGERADYWQLFDELANPHPPPNRVRSVVLGSRGKPSRPRGSQENITVLGEINARGRVSGVSTSVGRPDRPVTSPDQDSEYELVQLAGRRELARWPVPVDFELLDAATRAGSGSGNRGMFRVTAPYFSAARRIEIRKDDAVVFRRDVPKRPPRIELRAPVGGVDLAVGDTLRIAWKGSSQPGVKLTYRVEYSTDAGATYRLVQGGLKRSSFRWDHRSYAGSDDARIRVVASDGFNSAEAVSPPLRVAKKPPSVVIIHPRPGQMVPQGRSLPLLAVARDPEDGIIGDKLINWYVDGRIEVGSGAEQRLLSVVVPTPRGELESFIPLGRHRVSVQVRDSDGNVAQDAVGILIAADSDGDGYTDDEEVAYGTDPFNPLDHPGALGWKPFGQWQLTLDGRWSRFQVTNLTRRSISLEIALIDDEGEPLAQHDLDVTEGQRSRSPTTDSNGAFRLELGPEGSGTFDVRSRPDALEASRSGFGMIRLLSTEGATEATILAHGSIRDPSPSSSEVGYEATVVIACGEPFTLRAPVDRDPGTLVMKTSPPPAGRVGDLGPLAGAGAKGVVRAPRAASDVEG